MSRSVNKVTLIGTVGRDPETRFSPGGSAVASFSMATNESYNDKNTGQRVEQTEWHRIVAFGKLAEIMQQYVKKGSKLYVEGKLKTNEWEKDGIKRYSTDIVVNEMVMLDRAPSSGDSSGYAPQQGQVNNPYGANTFQGGQYPNQAAPAPQAQPQAYQPQGYPQQNTGGYGQPQGQAPQYQQQPVPQQVPVGQPPHPQAQPQTQQQPQPSNQFDGPEDDIPF